MMSALLLLLFLWLLLKKRLSLLLIIWIELYFHESDKDQTFLSKQGDFLQIEATDSKSLKNHNYFLKTLQD